ncbi:MAG TPA: ATP-binding protein [Rhodothermales bacterium]
MLAGELDPDRLMQTVTDEATALTGAEFGAFFYNAVNEQGESYVLYTLSGASRERFADVPMPRNTELFAPTFRGEGILRLDDVTRDPRFGRNPPFHGLPEGHLPVRSYLAVPVVSRSGEVLGGLFLGSSQVGIFDERHEQIVAGLAGHAAVAIDNARLLRAAQQEVAERRRAEEALRQAHDELEQRVAERTAELAAMNASLEQQVGVRQQAELALQEEREFLKAVLDNIQVGIVACNAEGRLTLFNQVTRELHGLPAEPLPPEQWAEHYDLYYPGGRTRMRPDDVPLKRAFAGERVRDVEMVIAPKDQPPRILLANGQAFYGADGRKRGAVVSMHDVTDQRRAEEEARRRTLELQEVVAELEAFSYSVSHDLRAPLRHIGGYADLLMKRARESLDEKSRRYLETISQAVQRAGHLIDDLLEFSRTSRRDMEHRPVDMQGQVAEVRQELEPEHEGRQVEWTIDPLPPAHGDRAMLWSVWYNLLSNAIKYTGRQQPARIHVGSRREGSEVVYFVRDNGIGFDMRYADKLFGVFQRLHSTNEFEGTGIGLANVRRIVARHGGRTWAESAPGAGATFYFSLPDAAEA